MSRQENVGHNDDEDAASPAGGPYRLTREVRFVIGVDGRLADGGTGHAGRPRWEGFGAYLTLVVTLAGRPEASSGYVRNIKEIDRVVRDRAIPRIARHVRDGTFGGGGGVLADVFGALIDAWPPLETVGVTLRLTPHLSLSATFGEFSMRSPLLRLSQTFEFSASHRLHNPSLSDAENRRTFGKCNNPHGHGHNYVIRVTLTGIPDADGRVIDPVTLERVVDDAVITPFDHKHLNIEVPEFAGPGGLNPSVEHIAKVAYERLRSRLTLTNGTRLASVTVWETPKTWCEYGEA